VPEAWISPTATLTGRVTESPDVVLLGDSGDQAAAEKTSTNRIAGQLAVILGDSVRVETDQLDIKLTGATNLRWIGGSVPVAEGQVFVNGKVEAWGPRLDISDGRVRWAQSPADNPQLDIRAERDVFGNTAVRSAGVHISGPAQRPEVLSYTQPLTTQERAWSVLLTGSDVDYGQGVGALDVGTYIAPRIFLSYGISLFDSDNVVGIRYDLKKGWGVKATSGARDSGVDLSYTIEQGKKKDDP
jgi:translocation and assembly module TamB